MFKPTSKVPGAAAVTAAGHRPPARVVKSGRHGRRDGVFVLAFRAAVLAGWLQATVAGGDNVTFNEHIRPILAENCLACHGADAQARKAKLRLDDADSAMAERDGIRAIVPGNPEASEVWQRIISLDEDEIMPPPNSGKSPLKPEQHALIKQWIEHGAHFQKHWAYEPVSRPPLPVVAIGEGDHPVDRFVGAKLAARGLALAPEESREVLLRRVTLDLTGLPPTIEEMRSFVSDHRPDAYERVVARLLGSIRYGEHFARYWLDAVRYADTHGMHLDNIRTIWPYRDWIVHAFNRNLPFDQFTIEQLAGDLLPSPTIEQLVATGYNRCNISTSESGAIEAEAEARNTADRVDTTAAVWLGMTANCASCHDHKFDPLTQREYYSLGAFFKGLADRVWDGNVRSPGPIAVVAPQEATRRRMEALVKLLPPLETALSARAAQLDDRPIDLTAPAEEEAESEETSTEPGKPAQTATYEVIWAEDGDRPIAEHFGQQPPPGEWKTGATVPVAGGQRALRLDGVVQRPVVFAGGEIVLAAGAATKLFVHVNPDPVSPPRAIGLQFIAEGETKQVIWGDATAFGPELAPNAIIVGPMPMAGVYSKLEIESAAVGLGAGAPYAGLLIAQKGGGAWWDRVGMLNTTSDPMNDPLLSKDAWSKSLRELSRHKENVPLRHDIKYLVAVSPTQHDEEERKRLARYHRDFIYGPLRGPLEAEANAVRRLLAEQVHYEITLPTTLIARERPEPLPARVLLRGQYDKPGDLVSPATPAFLPPLPTHGERPTRFDLARWLVASNHPLTSRVTVNRFWQQLFGAGIVRTPSDFGAQGEPPTHPELLDWLASEFMSTGWDVKALIRLLVMSRTYRQSSRATPELLEADPENKLLARSARIRLDAEVLRDQSLAIGGLLVPEVGGPPVKPYQPDNVWEPVAFGRSNTKVYVRDSGPALYRRSLYTFWKRTAPPPSMSAFDAPSREVFCVERGRSNTPLQALVLMNDVQHFEAARAFAERLLHKPGSDAERLAWAFRSVTARAPTGAEHGVLAEALATGRQRFGEDAATAGKVVANGESRPDPTLAPAEVAAWTLVANLLLNLDEAVSRN